MINKISTWAGNIVIAVIIVTILEMLLPDGKNKKYIKTVMGIYILFTILSPAIAITSGEKININEIIQTNSNSIKTNDLSIYTNASIESIYIKNLKNDIENKLQKKGYSSSNIDVVIEKDDEKNYGKIYEISINITKIKTESTTKSSVNTIQILIGDTGLKKELTVENSITNDEKEEIIEYLSSIYDVNKNSIKIRGE